MKPFCDQVDDLKMPCKKLKPDRHPQADSHMLSESACDAMEAFITNYPPARSGETVSLITLVPWKAGLN